MVKVDLSVESFASVIGGLYASYRGMDVFSVPPFFWQQLAYALSPFMDDWRYDIISFEEWLSTYLVITAEEVLTESELEEMKDYSVFIKAQVGNMTMVGAGDIIWVGSTSTSEEEKMENIK